MKRRALLAGLAGGAAVVASGAGYRYWDTRKEIRRGELSDYDPGRDYDVCIVGSGPAGCTLAGRLSAAGRRVLLLESGVSLGDGAGVQEALKLDVYSSSGALEYPVQSTRVRALGGTSTVWTGRCPRMLPSDFRGNPLAPEGGWPLGYGELQPYYRAAEETLSVVGGALTDSQAPREEDLPGEALQDISGLRALTDSLGIAIDAPPMSHKRRLFEKAGPLRSARDQLPWLSRRSAVEVLEGATVSRVLADARGRVRGLRVQSLGGVEREVKARRYVLAGGGLESTRLLLLSGDDRFPGGLGNQGGHLGRYFMEHPFVGYTAEVAGMAPFGSWQVGRTYQFCERLRGAGLGGAVLGFNGNPNKPQQLKIGLGIEMAPAVGNRIRLSAGQSDPFGDPGADVELDFSDRDRRLLAAGEEIVRDIFARLGGGEVHERDSLHWSGHHMGSTRMSAAAADGVVDPQLRVHGTQNLYVLSSSVYVTSGTANPTLTIVALAHRLADHLILQA